MTRLILILFFASKMVAASWAPDDITGLWYNAQKDAKIRIYKAGEKYYGKIEWLQIPNDPETGKPKVDKKNPDEKKRTRAVLGLNILVGLEWDAEDQQWTNGHIYDPKSGNTYKLTCKLKDKNNMNLTGYIGMSFIGRTDLWVRAEE